MGKHRVVSEYRVTIRDWLALAESKFLKLKDVYKTHWHGRWQDPWTLRSDSFGLFLGTEVLEN